MFYYINGKLVEADVTYAVLDVGGVAYKLSISGKTREALPPFRSVKEAPTVLLYTHFSVREDGFLTVATTCSSLSLSIIKLNFIQHLLCFDYIIAKK